MMVVGTDAPLDARQPRRLAARLYPLFEAVAEATEEAIADSLLQATTVHGRDGHTARALSVEPLRELRRRAGRRGR
jgi:L-aminopeptidase/D-esterase-like protein